MGGSSLRRAGAMGMMAAILGASLFDGNTGSSRFGDIPEPKQWRPCLKCGKEHQHNNSFCSAEYCRSYAAEKKSGVAALKTAERRKTVRAKRPVQQAKAKIKPTIGLCGICGEKHVLTIKGCCRVCAASA